MDNETLARLRSVYQGLTLGQRHYLKVIVESSPEVLGLDLCETLVDLGLVRPDGESLTATEEGRYVASLASASLPSASKQSRAKSAQ